MEIGDFVVDGFGRIRDGVHRTLKGVSAEDLVYRPDGEANSIAWLVWHLTRIQDDHIAGAAQTEQAWTAEGWYERFALPFDPPDHGYGHTSDEVAAVRPDSPDLLLGYHDAVYEHTRGYVQALTASDLDRIVDESWDPPVTLGVRLVSVLADDLQHLGQAAYVRGLAERLPS